MSIDRFKYDKHIKELFDSLNRNSELEKSYLEFIETEKYGVEFTGFESKADSHTYALQKTMIKDAIYISPDLYDTFIGSPPKNELEGIHVIVMPYSQKTIIATGRYAEMAKLQYEFINSLTF